MPRDCTTGRFIPSSDSLLLACAHCGKTFTVILSIARRGGRGKFCSWACRIAYLKAPTLEERFWKHVLKTDTCWLWQGELTLKGYGRFSFQKGNRRLKIGAHRVAYQLTVGPIPDGMEVCHSCDIHYPIGDISYRRCVHPDHLFLGTRTDNANDAAQKGRLATGLRNGKYTCPDKTPRGEAIGTSKLTSEQVQTIRLRYQQGGITQYELAAQYGVRQGIINGIVLRKTWKHVL